MVQNVKVVTVFRSAAYTGLRKSINVAFVEATTPRAPDVTESRTADSRRTFAAFAVGKTTRALAATAPSVGLRSMTAAACVEA